MPLHKEAVKLLRHKVQKLISFILLRKAQKNYLRWCQHSSQSQMRTLQSKLEMLCSNSCPQSTPAEAQNIIDRLYMYNFERFICAAHLFVCVGQKWWHQESWSWLRKRTKSASSCFILTFMKAMAPAGKSAQNKPNQPALASSSHSLKLWHLLEKVERIRCAAHLFIWVGQRCWRQEPWSWFWKWTKSASSCFSSHWRRLWNLLERVHIIKKASEKAHIEKALDQQALDANHTEKIVSSKSCSKHWRVEARKIIKNQLGEGVPLTLKMRQPDKRNTTPNLPEKSRCAQRSARSIWGG